MEPAYLLKERTGNGEGVDSSAGRSINLTLPACPLRLMERIPYAGVSRPRRCEKKPPEDFPHVIGQSQNRDLADGRSSQRCASNGQPARRQISKRPNRCRNAACAADGAIHAAAAALRL